MKQCPFCHQAVSQKQWQSGRCAACDADLSSDQTMVDIDADANYKTLIEDELNAEMQQAADVDATLEMDDSFGNSDPGDKTIVLDAGHALSDDEPGETIFDDIPQQESSAVTMGNDSEEDSAKTVMESNFSDEDSSANQTVVTDSGAEPFDENKTVVFDEDGQTPEAAQTLISDAGNVDVNEMIEKTWGMGIASVTDPGMTIKGSEAEPQSSKSQQSIPVRHLEPQANPSFPDAEYQLVKVLGEGGMGIVWNALQSSVERNVAIKMIKTAISKKQGQTEKFISEAIVTGDLEHPNIVPIHEMGQDRKGNYFYSMKHVQGTPWDKVIEKKTLHENLEILLSVCDAIAFAHARGIIHRDLKPENIMLGGYGEVLVMDWGLALPTEEFTKRELLTGSHGMGGTPAYMAPEMATGPLDKITYRSDVYLLGAILYEIITQRPPHRGKTVQGCLANAIRNVLTPTERDDELVKVATKAMDSEAANRYASVKDFQEAIRGYLAHEKSLKLSQRATAELNDALETEEYDKFSHSLFGFEEALVLWPENEPAAQGLLDAHYEYANCAYVKGDLDLAESLVDQNEPDQKELYENIQQAKQERARRQRMLRRAKVAVVSLAAAILLIGGFSYYLINKEMVRATAAEKIATTQKEIAEQRTLEVLQEKKKVVKQTEIANQERKIALANEKEAKKQRAIAVTEKDNAVRSREAEQYKSYIANIGLAAAKVEENAFADARTLLLQCPATLRNWEWGRLMYLCSQSSKQYLMKGPVDGLDFSPDGLKFATASWDGNVRIWERDSGKIIHELPHNKIYVHCLDWSANGNWIASGCNDKQGNLKIWDAESGKLLANITAHTDAVLGVQFSDDGRWLLTCSYDNTAKLWNIQDPQNPKTTATLLGHTWWVWDADFAPGFVPSEENTEQNSSNRVVTVGQDGKAIVWEISKQGTVAKPVVEFLEHKGPVYAVAFHPAGKQIATGGHDRKIRYWDPRQITPFDFTAAVNGEKKKPQKYATLAGHNGPVRAISFSHQGDLLISGAQDNTVKVWETKTGAALKTFRGHAGTVRACKMTNDGRYLLSGAEDQTAMLWSVNHYAEIQTLNGQELTGHRDAVLSAYFSPTGKDVLTASRDRTARIWETESGRERLKLKEGHQFLSSTALFFQNEKKLATAAADSSVRLWNATTGAELAHLLDTGRSALVAISSDDSLMVTGTNTNDLMVWKMDSLLARKEVKPLAQLTGHNHPVTAIEFIPQTHQLISCDTHGRCNLWNTETGEKIWSVRNHTLKVTDIRIFNQGQTLLTANIDQTIGVSSVKNGQEETSKVLSHAGPVLAIDLSPDESLLVSVVNLGDGEQANGLLKTELYLWQLENQIAVKPTPVKKILLQGFSTNDVSISHDKKTAVLTCSDNTIKKVDLETEKVITLLDGNQQGSLLWSSRLNGDGSRLLSVGGIDARLWDLKTGKKQMTFGPHGVVAATAIHPLENIIVTGSWDQSLKFWDARTGKSTGKINQAHEAYINCLNYSRDGNFLVTAGDEGIAKIWDAQTHKELLQLKGHTGGIHHAVFSPDDNLVLTASRDRTLRLWDRATGKQVGKPFIGHQWAVLSAKFSPDGNFIVSGSEDNNAIIWNRNSGKQLAEMSGHTAAVTSVAFSKDGMRILTASRDNTAKLWDATPGHRGTEILTLKRHQQEVTCVDFSVDRLHVLTGSRDGTAIIWSAIDWKKHSQ